MKKTLLIVLLLFILPIRLYAVKSFSGEDISETQIQKYDEMLNNEYHNVYAIKEINKQIESFKDFKNKCYKKEGTYFSANYFLAMDYMYAGRKQEMMDNLWEMVEIDSGHPWIKQLVQPVLFKTLMSYMEYEKAKTLSLVCGDTINVIKCDLFLSNYEQAIGGMTRYTREGDTQLVTSIIEDQLEFLDDEKKIQLIEGYIDVLEKKKTDNLSPKKEDKRILIVKENLLLLKEVAKDKSDALLLTYKARLYNMWYWLGFAYYHSNEKINRNYAKAIESQINAIRIYKETTGNSDLDKYEFLWNCLFFIDSSFEFLKDGQNKEDISIDNLSKKSIKTGNQYLEQMRRMAESDTGYYMMFGQILAGKLTFISGDFDIYEFEFKERTSECKNILKKMITEMGDKRGTTALMLAKSYENDGLFKNAIEVYKTIKNNDKKHPLEDIARYQMAECYLKLGEKKDAIEMLDYIFKNATNEQMFKKAKMMLRKIKGQVHDTKKQ